MAHTHFVDSLAIYAEVHMNHALNGSSAIQHFKHSYVIEIRDEIIFDFDCDCHVICKPIYVFLKSFYRYMYSQDESQESTRTETAKTVIGSFI